MLQRFWERQGAGDQLRPCDPDRAYRLEVAVDGSSAGRPNSDPVLEQVMHETAGGPAVLHSFSGLSTDSSFSTLANAYVVRIYDLSVESVTLTFDGVERDRAVPEEGWVVLGHRVPPAIDGNVAAAAGIGRPIDLILTRADGQEVAPFGEFDPALDPPSCR